MGNESQVFRELAGVAIHNEYIDLCMVVKLIYINLSFLHTNILMLYPKGLDPLVNYKDIFSNE